MTEQTLTPETEPAELSDLEKLSLADEVFSDHVTLSDAEKLDYVFRKFLELDQLIEQAAPLLEQAGPLLGQLTGQASSPLGRIAGSLFR